MLSSTKNTVPLWTVLTTAIIAFSFAACGGTEAPSPDDQIVGNTPVLNCTATQEIKNGACVAKTPVGPTDQEVCETQAEKVWENGACVAKTPVVVDCEQFAWMNAEFACYGLLANSVNVTVMATQSRCDASSNPQAFVATIVMNMDRAPVGNEAFAVPLDDKTGFTVHRDNGFGTAVESFDCTR